MLATLAAAFFVVLLSGSGPHAFTGRLGGDFPAFYGMGRLIVEGDWRELYSLEQQREFQKGMLETDQTVNGFYYPPHTAFLYAPLSQLPFRAAYALYVLILVAALVSACLLVRRLYPQKITNTYVLFAAALAAHPILRSIMGGQNTALSILLVVLCWYNVERNRPYLAGFFLGLLFFKPQFALPLLGLFLLSGRWRTWVAASLTGAVLFAASTALIGPSWFADWTNGARLLFAWSMTGNAPFVVSAMGLAHATFGGLTPAAFVVGWSLTLAAILALSWAWWRGGSAADLGSQMALACVFIVAISPQTLFYDAGLVLIAMVVMWARAPQVVMWLAPLLIVTSYLQLASPAIGTASLTLLPLVLIQLAAVKICWTDATTRRLDRGVPVASG